ncbi:hypothetical protein [Anoxybacillus sp. UARK-01]
MLSSRNVTAHVYNEEDDEQIKQKIVDEYVQQIEALLQNIKEEVIDRDAWNERLIAYVQSEKEIFYLARAQKIRRGIIPISICALIIRESKSGK